MTVVPRARHGFKRQRRSRRAVRQNAAAVRMRGGADPFARGEARALVPVTRKSARAASAEDNNHASSGSRMSCSRGSTLYVERAMQFIDHPPNLMRHQNVAKFGISAGPADFRDLNRAGRELKSPGPPCLVNAVRWSDGRDESAEQDVAVEHDTHQRRRAHSNASSTASWISFNDRPRFFALASATVVSKMRARTASSTNRESSPCARAPARRGTAASCCRSPERRRGSIGSGLASGEYKRINTQTPTSAWNPVPHPFTCRDPDAGG